MKATIAQYAGVCTRTGATYPPGTLIVRGCCGWERVDVGGQPVIVTDAASGSGFVAERGTVGAATPGAAGMSGFVAEPCAHRKRDHLPTLASAIIQAVAMIVAAGVGRMTR